MWRPGPDGRTVLDTDGVVKGWAVHRAARHLVALPGTDVCLGGGGDLVCWTADPAGEPWQVGIEDPRDPRALVARVPCRRAAVATSSAAHRGQHVVDARTGRPPAGVASVTVVAADLVAADVDATAAFAQGRRRPGLAAGAARPRRPGRLGGRAHRRGLTRPVGSDRVGDGLGPPGIRSGSGGPPIGLASATTSIASMMLRRLMISAP